MYTSKDDMMILFTRTFGVMTSGCYTEVEENDSGSAIAVNVMKDGNLCWSANKVDILFELALREE